MVYLGAVKEASKKYMTFVGDTESCSSSSSQIESEEEQDQKLTSDDSTKSYGTFFNTRNQTKNASKRKSTSNSNEPSAKRKKMKITKCDACLGNDLPTGLHKCIFCNKNVHLFDECSKSCDDEEGCGERRICIQCFDDQRDQKEKCISQEKVLNTKEGWNKNNKQKRTKRKSIYTHHEPNWKHVNDPQKPKISVMENATFSKCTYTVNNETISLKNTCAFDSLTQVSLAECLLC